MRHTLDELRRIDNATLSRLVADCEELRNTGVSVNTLLREWLSNFYLQDEDDEKFSVGSGAISLLPEAIYREAARRFRGITDKSLDI